MKFKFLLFILFALVANLKSFSQCTPVVFPGTGLFSPDTIQNLPKGAATGQYSATIQFNIPTTINIGTVYPIDSAEIASVSGLPSGLSFLTNSPNNKYKSGTRGCGLIQGTIAANQLGLYPLVFNLKVLAFGTWFPRDFTGFSITVLDASHVGILEKFTSNEKFTFYQNNSTKTIQIKSIENNSQVTKIQMVNILGQVVFESNTELNSNAICTISTDAFKAGLYVIKLVFSNNEVASQKVIVQ